MSSRKYLKMKNCVLIWEMKSQSKAKSKHILKKKKQIVTIQTAKNCVRRLLTYRSIEAQPLLNVIVLEL